jgi:hypothetical protein
MEPSGPVKMHGTMDLKYSTPGKTKGRTVGVEILSFVSSQEVDFWPCSAMILKIK